MTNDNNNPLTTTSTSTSTERSQENRRSITVAPEEHQKVVTEGQLKWAQFHYKRRALSVREKVEALWQIPASASDVEGAQSDDGNTTVEENFSFDDDDAGEEDVASRKMLLQKLEVARNNRPSISRGRRAMLRVSKRAFAKRREEIERCGFRCSSDGDIVEDDYNNNGDEALAAKFADETAWKKARRNRRRRKAKSTQESLRRFENAFRAMMMSLAASQPQNPEIIVPTKVWSRPEDTPAFVSIDGRQYRDLKWGVSASNEKVAHLLTTTDFASMPVDPRASWLVHIPSKPQHDKVLGAQHDIPTNADGELLVPENIDGKGEKMIPIPLGSEKFNEIVGTLQSQADMSQQQKEQLELIMKNRSHDFKWQIANHSQGRFHEEFDEEDDQYVGGDDDDYDYLDGENEEEDEALDPEHLKTIAAQYLTEFVANADEDHLIAALGEQYKDEVETLVEAASDHGLPTGRSKVSESKDIVLNYLQGMKPPTNTTSNDSEMQQNSNQAGGNQQLNRNQMASFAGIAARYLAELSRPRQVEKTINSCRQEQSLLVKDLKVILEELYSSSRTSSDSEENDTTGALFASNQHRIESIVARYTIAKGRLDGYTEADVVNELRQREGREFLKLLVTYLDKVKNAASKLKESRTEKKRSTRRGSVASRYMQTLGKEDVKDGSETSSSQEEPPTEDISEEQALMERIAVEFLAADEASTPEDLCEDRDIVAVLRKEKETSVPNVVVKYLQALSDTIATGKSKNTELSLSLPSETLHRGPVDHFTMTSSIFNELGTPTGNEVANHRIFEAITSRYLSNIKSLNEDAIFVGFGKTEFQGFSRITTKYLDEIMQEKHRWKLAKTKGAPATRYLKSLFNLPEVKQGNLNQNDVETIVAQYLDEIAASSHKSSIFSEARQEERLILSKLVSSYLGALCEALEADMEENFSMQQTGEVSMYLKSPRTRSVNNFDSQARHDETEDVDVTSEALHTKSNGTTAQMEKPSTTATAPSGARRRSPLASEGVAAGYLSAVVDAEDYEEQDIFAELRKQDSPKFVEGALPSDSHPVVPHQRDFESVSTLDAVPPPLQKDSKKGFGEVHVETNLNLHSETPDMLSPLTQTTGFPQAADPDISLDRKTSISYLSRLRPDCHEQDIQIAIGSIGNDTADRAQFARGVTELLMGVKEGANPKRSRAAASRYLAAMRGLPVGPEPDSTTTFVDNFDSALIDDAAEMLADCSCQGDPPSLAKSLRRLGKDDGERFAGFIGGYLNGSIVPPSNSDEPPHDGFLSNAPIPDSSSPTESDFFAGMRQKKVNTNHHLLGNPSQDLPMDVKRLSYGSKGNIPFNPSFSPPAFSEIQHEGTPVPSTALPVPDCDENVLKNTFDSIGNRRGSYRNDLEEEKKTTQSLSGSSSSDHVDTATTERDAENIPMDPTLGGPPHSQSYRQHPTSTHDNGVNSPSRRSIGSLGRSQASPSEFSPERLRDFHQSVMEKSALIGQGNAEQTIIDTDGTTSEASDTAMSPRRLAGLMLSPTILTKRHKQAVHAIQNRKWDQASYLLSANPWLAEMPEISTNQYLLHKIAFYGAGNSIQPPAPEELCTEVVKMYPAVQKFDRNGCLPLHSASEAGNIRMIALLGDRFPSGASVRNEEGMLPIHLAISSHGKRREDAPSLLLDVVKSVLSFFPGGLAVADNAGNLPLHIAAKCLNDDEGIDVINFLLDEADKQVKRPDGIRFRNKPKAEDAEESVIGTIATVTRTDVNSDGDDDFDDELPCSMVENDAGKIPLWIALARMASPGIVESLIIGPGGRQSALKKDSNGNTSLHFLLLQDQIQMKALKSILKVAPECALEANVERMLPIEMACLKGASPDVVLELLLVDLPIFLSERRKPTGQGESLWFLACECHDRYLGVIETLVSMCSYQQVHELAFMTRDDSRSTLISCASPECGEFLTVSLLFVGRFEFLQYQPQEVNGEVKVFDALDYGAADAPYEEGRRVNLRCFTSEEQYKEEISPLRSLELDFDYVEQVSCFVVGDRDSFDSGGRRQYCVAIEQPSLTLDRVVAGMLKNDNCRENTDLRKKYVLKMFSVLRIVAKALHRLHSFGVVHGNLVPQACGKCGDAKWKLLGTLGFQKLGAKFDTNVFGESVPPEALEPQNSAVAIDRQATFRTNLAVDPAMDVWGFGKLSYDVLVGQSLVEFDRSKELHHDHRSLLKILHWSTLDLVDVRKRLRQVGVPDSAAYLFTRCLSPDPSGRPSMNEVLRSWDEDMQHRHPAQMTTEGSSDLHEC